MNGDLHVKLWQLELIFVSNRAVHKGGVSSNAHCPAINAINSSHLQNLVLDNLRVLLVVLLHGGENLVGVIVGHSLLGGSRHCIVVLSDADSVQHFKVGGHDG